MVWLPPWPAVAGGKPSPRRSSSIPGSGDLFALTGSRAAGYSSNRTTPACALCCALPCAFCCWLGTMSESEAWLGWLRGCHSPRHLALAPVPGGQPANVFPRKARSFSHPRAAAACADSPPHEAEIQRRRAAGRAGRGSIDWEAGRAPRVGPNRIGSAWNGVAKRSARKYRPRTIHCRIIQT